jgi:hypothetical protein
VIDLARAITYPLSGQNTLVRTFVGGMMVLLMPVFFLTGFVLLGYQLRVIRDVIDEQDHDLPDWDHAFEDFVQGVIVLLGSLLYYIPSFILAGLGAAAGWQAISGVRDALNPFNRTPVAVDQTLLSMMCVYFLLALVWLVLSAPLTMAATARYAETGEFSAFTHILTLADEVWDQRRAAGELALNLFILTILAQIVSMVASVTCLIGPYVQFIQLAAIFHLTGQWGALLKRRRPVIRPIKPPRRRA